MLGRNFVIFFYVPVLTVFIVVMGLNIYVDPLKLFGDPQPGDQFPIKSFESIPEHLTLPIVIRNTDNIGTLIVGSSTARYLLDTPSSRVKSSEAARKLFPHTPIFNAALSGGTVHMALSVIKHALAFHDIKEIVYVLNFDGLSAKRKVSENFLPKQYDGLTGFRSYARILPILWSYETTADSFNTIALNRLTPRSTALTHESKGILSVKQRWLRNTSEYLYPGLYSDFEMTESEVDAIKKIIALAKSRDIKLSIIVSPIHPVQMEMIYETGKFKEYSRHLNSLNKLCEKNKIPLVAFNIYAPPFASNFFNSETEAFGSDRPSFSDGVHFNPPLGMEISNFLKGHESQYGVGFGIKLTSKNLGPYMLSLSNNRRSYLLNNEIVKKFVFAVKKVNPRLNK